MSTKLKLNTNEIDGEYKISFKGRDFWETDEDIFTLETPVKLELWDGSNKKGKKVLASGYQIIDKKEDGIRGESVIEDELCAFKVIDLWQQLSPDTWQLKRKIEVQAGSSPIGLRQRLDLTTAFPEGTEFNNLRYFAPPALFDKNDLDQDGVPDYLGTQNLMYREDRLNMPAVMAYHPQREISMTLMRHDLPKFDSRPERPQQEKIFYQKTDVGSLGFWKNKEDISQMDLRATYPFYEGESTRALLNEERSDWEAFWPAEKGDCLEVSYKIIVKKEENYHQALWNIFSRVLKEIDPDPVQLPTTSDQLTEYRLSALDRYYYEEENIKDDNPVPAGFVLNCHPQDGKQLSNIIQYGFTGQNILNAYNYLQFGYEQEHDNYINKALKVIDFFVQEAHIEETGMFYNLYNVDKEKMDFWWTGLLLPLAYASPGESLEKLMGPIYHHWNDVIDQLQKMKGSYLRCMSEDAYALLLSFEIEAARSNRHEEWLATARRYGEFLVATQEEDGSWYRAYDLEGEPITEPEIWFGTTMYERKSSSGTPIPFLVKLYEITQEQRYLETALKGGKFVRENIIDPVKFNGGIHDSMYSKGQLIDNEGILYPMLGMLSLYKTVGGDYFRTGLIRAARLCASWICLWDVPLPEDSTLAQYNFRSTGMGACDTCGAAYVHPFQLKIVGELIEIAGIANDEVLLDVAELTFHGCNQTVSVPGKDWGYRYQGLQEEGYLISWLLIDDPVFEETEFGDRLKGEGNKTCFPWITAVSVYNYWNMLDKFNSFNFDDIKKEVLNKS